MTSDRDRYLDKLSPDELLLYVARGGQLATKLSRLRYAQALAGLSIRYVPTPADLTRLLAERNPQGMPKSPKPLVYRPHRGRHRAEPVKVEVQRRKTA